MNSKTPSISRSPVRQVWLTGIHILLGFTLFGIPVGAAWGQSGAPDLKTPAPVIYLADNLDEQDKLGYCIDTVGRGFGERLHAHSCKPRGGDVQFTHDPDARRIMSATFAGKCAELLAPAAPGVTLGLLDCAGDSSGQTLTTPAMKWNSGPVPTRRSAWRSASRAGRRARSCHVTCYWFPATRPTPGSANGSYAKIPRESRPQLTAAQVRNRGEGSRQ